jgi:hypothetical protein
MPKLTILTPELTDNFIIYKTLKADKKFPKLVEIQPLGLSV